MNTSIYKFEKLIGVGNVELLLNKNHRVYTFIGTNGVGKTKCLEALFQLFFFSEVLHPSNSYRYCPAVFKAAQFDDTNVIAQELDGLSQLRFGSVYTSNNPMVFVGAGLRGRLQGERSHIDAIGTFEQRRAVYFQNILNQMQKDFSILGNDPDGLDVWFVKRAQSANPYQKEKDNREVEITTLLKVLHDIDERFDISPIEISGDNKVELSINGSRRKLSELSSGFASLLKILQAIISGYANITNEVNLTHVRGKVFIDEIESHLHSEWQAKIIPLLKSSFPNTTFFITTHSPIVLTQLSEGEAYQLRRDDDGVVRSHLIPQPNNQLLADLLVNAFSVNLNQLKSKQLENDDQSDVKKMMLDLLGNGEAQ
jgi:AAA15 family ATPase/GTPase